VADPVVPAVEALGVHEVEPVHAARDVLARGLDDKVEVVVEHAVGVEQPAEAPLRVVDPAHDRVAVEVVAGDELPCDAAHRDVDDAVRRQKRGTGAAGHDGDGTPASQLVLPGRAKWH
jgi:hypothetical protein